MRFCSVTLGCKVNAFETQAIEGFLASRGHERARPREDCDVCIVNTCAVTAESAGKSRQAVRRMRKTVPGAIIAVCGCYSQLEPGLAASIGADIVGGSGGRERFAEEIERLFFERELYGGAQSGAARLQSPESAGSGGMLPPLVDDPARRVFFEELPAAARYPAERESGGAPGRTRALLKIQDGCDGGCAYCVIPLARGPSRSLPPARAAEQARVLSEQGYREIVITGIEISSYGRDLEGRPTLAAAAREIGAAAPDARLRLGSLDPGFVDERFCEELRGVGNLCDHFHLSLQSGCDDTLRDMGRKYGAGFVMEAIGSLRRVFPGCGITADLIAGFPGESDADFGRTLEFIRSASFSGMHIFRFSPRPGTRAAGLAGQVAGPIKRARAAEAAAAAAEMAQQFRLGLVGESVEVLFERERGGRWVGHAGNYVEVAALSGGGRNAVRRVRVRGVEGETVYGEIIR